MTNWSAWNFKWRCIKGLGVRVKGRAGTEGRSATPNQSRKTKLMIPCTDGYEQPHSNPWSFWGGSTTLIASGLVEYVPAHSIGVGNR